MFFFRLALFLSCLLTLYTHSSLFCVLVLPVVLLDFLLPRSFKALSVLFHLLKFLILGIPHSSFSPCMLHNLVCLHLTPLENEHHGVASKGWRAKELPQGLMSSSDLAVLCDCLVFGRKISERAHHSYSKCSLSFNEPVLSKC